MNMTTPPSSAFSHATHMPRLLFLHPRSWTGDIYSLQALQEQGFEVCVLEEDRKSARGRYHHTPNFEQIEGIPTLWYHPKRHWARWLCWPLDVFLKRGFDGRSLLHRMLTILYATHHFKPDIIYCGDAFTYALPAGLLRRFGWLKTPVMAQAIGGDVLDVPEAEVGKRRTGIAFKLMQWGLPYLDRFRAISPLIQDTLEEIFHIAADRIFVLPNHLPLHQNDIDHLTKQRLTKREEIRLQYGIPKQACVFVTLSGNLKGKGIHLFANIWSIIQTIAPNSYWLLCGPDNAWFSKNVLPLIEPSIVNGRILLTGSLPQHLVYSYYAAGDLFINPTLADGLNMTVIEAALMQLPAICSSHAGVATWVTKYDAGWVTDSNHSSDFINTIKNALSSLQNRSIAEAYQERALAMSREFTPERIFTALKTEIYRLLPETER
ncbi:glycosyltransferase family 4 protein [Parvibium lacunae]|uniref:Glycosyltransferase n=1 Tax=Parvibium lacunae TaxID=1888893 RepID=A0A368L457_9BURK|nr:glycosyltransferase family 4 protein [Parvibium lacunae]RCS58305.1 glycosyltransferase [Parvibium lacunae]